MCNDFTRLNKYCPKDPYPLPRIDQLVDSTAGCALLSFMDAYQGFYQIRMAKEDIERTTFFAVGAVYYFVVMPFGLKNAGATYQRAMTVIFHDLIHKILEDYVDDILVKSLNALDHLSHLEEVFNRLAEYRLMLNPKKCVFDVTSGKLLGFIVSRCGIEIDPKNVKAIMDMAPPKTLKHIHSLQDKLQSV